MSELPPRTSPPGDPGGEPSPSTSEPEESTKKPWYRRVTTYMLVTALAGVTAFGSGAVERILNTAVDDVGSPLQVESVRAADCPYNYVIPGSPATTPIPPSVDTAGGPAERDAWAFQLGGVDGGYTDVAVTVVGTSDRPVVLRDLRVEIVSRNEPIDGFEAHAECGDLVAVRFIRVDLDQRPPVVTASRDDRNLVNDAPDVPEAPIDFPYTVTRTGVETFSIFAVTSACNCSWRGRLLWSAGDRSGEVVIDDNGRPFQTHFTEGYARYASTYGDPLSSG